MPAPGRATVRFYAELNDHLPPALRHRDQQREFFTPPSVKDLIESCGVPHTEVELILVNGDSCDFSRRIQDGDRISVYPMFEALDISPELRVRPEPLRHPSFVLDVHLGRLAAYLRMLGFDSYYRSCASDEDLASISVWEKRILLTRDRGLLMRAAVTHGYWLRETDSRLQTAEVIRRFDLVRLISPFARCMACNQELPPDLPDQTRQCPRCRRLYWRGSHYARMVRWIEELRGAGPADRSPTRPSERSSLRPSIPGSDPAQ